MTQPQLFALVYAEVQRLINGYVQVPAILEHIERSIVPLALGCRAGVLGASTLAEDAAAH